MATVGRATVGRATSRGAGLLYAAALLSTLPILYLNVWPVLSARVADHHATHWVTLLVHALGGLSMLVLGSAALYIGWTRRGFAIHRYVGYGYLILGSVGALAAVRLSLIAAHPPRGLYVATGTLACVWLAVAAMAWRAAHNRRFESHREWMVRSYVLTWTFVGCRLAGLLPSITDLGAEAVTAAIWVNWIVPLVVCEIALQWRRGARAEVGPAS